jgi:membrane fusion protein, multidrug efflux system
MPRKQILSLILVLALSFGVVTLRLEAHDSDSSDHKLLDSRPEIRAYLTPKQRAPLTSLLDAEIVEIAVHEGDVVSAGQTLLTFDCTALNAQLNKARAVLDAAKDKYLVMKQLLELNSVGSLETKASLSDQKRSKADVDFYEASIRGCVITAPFPGKVSKVEVRERQFVLEGQNLVEIIDNLHLEMEMVLPSSWLSWLRPGSPFSIKINETGKHYPAQVVRVGAEADPISQTFKAIGNIKGTHRGLVPGMSGAAVFNLQGKTKNLTPITSRKDKASSNAFSQ